MHRYPVVGLGIMVAAASSITSAQMIAGIGSDSCGSYTLAIAKNAPTHAIQMDRQLFYTHTAAYAQWISGYLSANDLAGRSFLARFDFNGIMMWIKNYCDGNPTRPIAAAAQAFVEAHHVKSK